MNLVSPDEAGCMAPDCESPAFQGRESDEHGHAVVDGKTYHFGCLMRLRAVATRDLPAIDSAERAVRDAVPSS